MAEFNVPLTIPDGKLSTFIDALRWSWGPIQDGEDENGPVMRDKTPAELKAEAAERQREAYLDIYRRYVKEQASSAAIASADADIAIT